MSLAAQVAERRPVVRGCIIARCRAAITDEGERVAFDAIILNEGDAWPTRDATKALHSEGITVGRTAILEHRRRDCCCDWSNE